MYHYEAINVYKASAVLLPLGGSNFQIQMLSIEYLLAVTRTGL